MKTVCVSGRVPMAFSMSKYCVISSKSTTSFDEAPLICSFDVKSLIEFLRPARIRLRDDAAAMAYLRAIEEPSEESSEESTKIPRTPRRAVDDRFALPRDADARQILRLRLRFRRLDGEDL